ncbi:MAG: hypothetical protein WBA57_08200 [Elainellaceae cyanobacterium]
MRVRRSLDTAAIDTAAIDTAMISTAMISTAAIGTATNSAANLGNSMPHSLRTEESLDQAINQVVYPLYDLETHDILLLENSS